VWRVGGRKGREGRRCSDGGGERRVRRERDNAGVAGSDQSCRGARAGGFLQNITGLCKKGTSLEFPLLHVRIKFTLGVYVKSISTWILFMDDELDRGLVFKQIEGFSVKLSEAYVQHGSEPRSPKFSGGSGLRWVLTSSD